MHIHAHKNKQTQNTLRTLVPLYNSIYSQCAKISSLRLFLISIALSRSVQLTQFDLCLFCIHLQIILNALKIRKSLKSCSWYILIILYYTILNGCVFFRVQKLCKMFSVCYCCWFFCSLSTVWKQKKNMFHLIESNVRIFRHPNFILFYFIFCCLISINTFFCMSIVANKTILCLILTLKEGKEEKNTENCQLLEIFGRCVSFPYKNVRLVYI